MILSLSVCESGPVGGIGVGLLSTALALILVLLVTILQLEVQFIPPLAIVLLWQLSQFAWITLLTALNSGPGVPEQAAGGWVGGVSLPLSPLLQENNITPVIRTRESLVTDIFFIGFFC